MYQMYTFLYISDDQTFSRKFYCSQLTHYINTEAVTNQINMNGMICRNKMLTCFTTGYYLPKFK